MYVFTHIRSIGWIRQCLFECVASVIKHAIIHR